MHMFFNTKRYTPKDTLLNLGNPPDDYQYYPFLTPLQLHLASPLHYRLALLVDRYIYEPKGDRGPKQSGVYRHHWQRVFLRLTRSHLSNSWLLVSLGGFIRAFHLDRRPARVTVDVP